MKTIFIQLWIGEIPDYFWFHYETTKNLSNFDFLIITDQTNLKLDAVNYKILFYGTNEIQELLRKKTGFDSIKIVNNKKICDLKASLGHLFENEIKDYSHFGVYDIDTLFGNIDKVIQYFHEGYEIVSLGDDIFHNRIGGPFIIFENKKEIREFYIHEDFERAFDNDNVVCYEEQDFYNRAKGVFKIKIINDEYNVDKSNGGKNIYESFWTSGNLYVNGEEKILYHFYRKNETKIIKNGNIISTFYKKDLVDDFYWVIHFSESYEKFLPTLMRSIKKYSNRRCILYSINYFPKIAFESQYFSDQFIFKEIRIPKGTLDFRGRDLSILTSKPLILLDAIKTFPEKKFVHIDTDIYLTTNSDSISKYIEKLENYPLANSHVHDVIYVSGVIPGEEWTSSLHILLKEEKIGRDPIFPRRKCNIILFDSRSEWFFKEQMYLYEKYLNSEIPGILFLHDEDTFNAILAKYSLTKSLPLSDIEETYNLKIDKIHNYSYNIITKNISPNLIPPATLNDFLFFHGFKNVEDYFKIENEYGNTVLDCEELVITYKDNTLFFEKNSFLTTKNISGLVDFVVSDINRNVIFKLENQDLNRYWVFYISNFYLARGKYIIEIYKKDNNHKIYNNILKIN